VANEVDVSRAINALTATLNDQKLESFDADRIQEIVTGALDGEQKLIAYGSGASGELRESAVDGPAVARLSYENGTWAVTRVPEARESDDLQEFEEQRAAQKTTEYQKPVRGRFAIWKKRLTGGG
jgi:hypothetical protein